jgi:hypothetical protein
MLTYIGNSLKRLGCSRIRFRLKRLEVYLSSRTIYKVLKRHCLNILKCKIKNRRYKRFAKKHPNDMVQMDILGPFYIRQSSAPKSVIERYLNLNTQLMNSLVMLVLSMSINGKAMRRKALIVSISDYIAGKYKRVSGHLARFTS